MPSGVYALIDICEVISQDPLRSGVLVKALLTCLQRRHYTRIADSGQLQRDAQFRISFDPTQRKKPCGACV
jgi:hypothetical protein